MVSRQRRSQADSLDSADARKQIADHDDGSENQRQSRVGIGVCPLNHVVVIGTKSFELESRATATTPAVHSDLRTSVAARRPALATISLRRAQRCSSRQPYVRS